MTSTSARRCAVRRMPLEPSSANNARRSAWGLIFFPIVATHSQYAAQKRLPVCCYLRLGRKEIGNKTSEKLFRFILRNPRFEVNGNQQASCNWPGQQLIATERGAARVEGTTPGSEPDIRQGGRI